ncbi:hypothetical protein PVAG01_02651 [Phlyctema vagabunda]|uniref:Uncharacterized protein n=1 Tax=Phlyctema vagabunda TaxID=108571 RepID=A0ABR4PR72_9HELO
MASFTSTCPIAPKLYGRGAYNVPPKSDDDDDDKYRVTAPVDFGHGVFNGSLDKTNT